MRWIYKSSLDEKPEEENATRIPAEPCGPDPQPTTDDEKQESKHKDRRP